MSGMKKSRLNTTGFTFVELLVVVALFGIVATISIVGFQNFARFQQYNQAVSEVVAMLTQARMNARSAVADESHGIKFAPSTLTQFVGDTFVVGDPRNIVATYGSVTFTYALTNGVDEVVFQKLTGLPSATGTITVSGTAFTDATVIEITGTGVVQ